MMSRRPIDLAAAAADVTAVLARAVPAAPDALDRRLQGRLLDPPSAWREAAACRTLHVGMFYDPSRTERALAVCARCPVRPTCLREALDEESAMTGSLSELDKVVHGVRGGTTAGDRVEVLAQRLRDMVDDVHPLIAATMAADSAGRGVSAA